MIIRTYIVKEISQAQEVIERDLGPNAIILTSRTIKPKGIRAWFSKPYTEITAAIDEDELKVHQQMHGITPVEEFGETKMLTTNNLRDNLSSVKKLLVKLAGEEVVAQINHSKKDLLHAGKGLLSRFNDNEHADEVKDQSAFISFLKSKGIAHQIAVELANRVNKRLGIQEIPSDAQQRTEMFNLLKRELAAAITTSGPLTLKQGKPKLFAIVGQTGVGKTTTIVKIALQYVQDLKKRVALITLDTSMIGAFEYINALAKNFGLPLEQAGTVEQLQKAIDFFQDYDLILIDTCGRCQYKGQNVSELADILNSVEGLETHLALSATTKDIDVIAAIQQFGKLNIDSLIFTKLDESIAHGILVNACLKTGMRISYLTNGQKIPGDLHIANSDEIARDILVENNVEEFDRVRQFANSSIGEPRQI